MTRSLSHNLSLGGQYDRPIEDNLHWQLDVGSREDECRVRADNAPANLSVIRRFALGLLKREAECRRGIETKLTRLSNLAVWRIPAEASQELATLAERSMQLQATIQEGVLMLANGQKHVDIEPVRWK